MWTEEQFVAWKQRPETKQFLAYLRDFREQLKERWANGELTDGREHYIAMAYGDLLELDYEFVAQFYGLDEGDDGDQE